MGRLRVVLPMLTYVPGAMGGSETYAREVVAELARRPGIDLTVLVSAAAAGVFAEADEIVVDRVTGGSSTTDRLRSLAEAAFPGAAARAALAGADVVHHLFTVPVPSQRGIPHVVTLLDVQHHDLPRMFSRAERGYRALAYDRAARSSDRVITISEFAKQSITERLGVSPVRIDVALLGVDHAWFSPYPTKPREDFVFYPAAAWPHKNHARLFEAMALVRKRRPGLRLVLTGADRAALGVLPDWVEHRGHVERSAVLDLYRRAACLVFPSLYEGFGLPPLEAMATGCPVAVSTSGALPEVCGDAAVTFDATSVPAIAAGIEEAMVSAPVLVDRGLVRAAAFTWEGCADAHLASYRAAVGRR